MPTDCDPIQLRQLACDLARIGGESAERLFGKVTVTRKPDQSPVTEADHVAQDAILRALASQYPDHAVLVEETLHDPQRHAALSVSDYCWVIDPIDGTRNFARGARMYATSVAVLHHGRPVAGAIYEAACREVYSASLGGGATRGVSPLHVTDNPPSADTIIAVSSFRRQPAPAAVRGWMDRFLMRNQGATSLHFAWTAAGLVDAAFSNECKLWDIAAAALLIEEAAGVMSDDQGNAIWPVSVDAYQGEDLRVLGGTPTVHRALLATLRGE